MEAKPQDGVVIAAGPVRGTQSLVHTLGRCWRTPSLTALEVMWRWMYGLPALVVIVWYLRRILAAHTGGSFDVTRLGLDARLLADPVGTAAADPMGAVGKWSGAIAVLLPDVLHVARWLVPVLLVGWVVVSSLGRTVVLRRLDAGLHRRPGTLMGLQGVRMVALGASFLLWFSGLRWAVGTAITAPMQAGGEPNLVLYFALSIVLTLGLFTLWGVVSWVLSVAPLIAMLQDKGFGESLKSAMRLGRLRSKLVEINLVMGIVKIALIVLAMVFSASPLPFESEVTQGFLIWWWGVVSIFYLVGSDFFHVARLMAYLDLWRAYERSDLD